jgi:hypothetical protein
MGLAISAIAATEDVAVTMVPIALIPQIVLAGLIAPLLHYTRQCAQLCISAYWSYQGLLLSLDAPLQKRLRVAETLDLNSNWSTSVACLVLVVHILAFSSVAWLVLQLGDARHRHARPRRAGDGPGRRG